MSTSFEQCEDPRRWDESQIDETPPNPEKTVMRIRKMLASRGHKHKSFLEALLEYWGVAQV